MNKDNQKIISSQVFELHLDKSCEEGIHWSGLDSVSDNSALIIHWNKAGEGSSANLTKFFFCPNCGTKL